MQIEVDKRSNRIVVHCAGRLDAHGAQVLEDEVLPLLRGTDLTVYLDLAGVDYLASAGIRSLIILVRSSAEGADPASPAVIRLRVVQLTPNVQQVLKTAGLLEDLTQRRLLARPSGPGAEPEDGYLQLLEQVRLSFPAPVSDPVKDGYFVQVVSQGLDRLDKLKTRRPFLGERTELDYEEAMRTTVPERMSSLEETVADLAGYMEGLFIWGHPRTQENVIPPASIPSIIGHLFASVYNPNIIWDEYGHRLGQAEVEVSSMCASMVGYDPASAAGIFTFGGTGTVIYGVKLGLEKAQPGAFSQGVRENLKVISSDAGHYSKLNALGWLGMGTDNLVTVPTDQDNSMGLPELESVLRSSLDRGEKIACIIATMGSTDAFGMDNLQFLVGLRDRLVEEYQLPYRPHIHADAVIGWAWAVFNDYDFDTNPLGFTPRTLRSLWDAHMGVRALELADSMGLDFHKTGYTSYVSSLFLCKDRDDLNLISRDTSSMPYLFQFGNYHPGVFTMETSRSGGGVLAALANLKAFGKEGYRAILGHIVTMAESLRHHLENSPYAVVANSYNYGPVTLFRLYPDGVEAKQTYKKEVLDPEATEQLLAHNDYNRRIFKVLQKQMEAGRGLALSITDSYRVAACGEPIVALKSFVMSPFVDEEAMGRLLKCLFEARSEVS